MVDMAIHIMIFEGFPLLMGKGSGDGHCHTKPSSDKFSSLFWEREGVVARYGHGVGWSEPLAEEECVVTRPIPISPLFLCMTREFGFMVGEEKMVMVIHPIHPIFWDNVRYPPLS